ncbi:WAP four-disulfide core domain protein 1 [Lates japonicus]|uniref:WAP four-disulfide core domain protein 1 n=1 Tax=Lates japonicus TaxID=270547 RepID=A0AAD3N874_LATJO|nr:WAP four-disulfide core domain protein 1 [Lates japonicus]
MPGSAVLLLLSLLVLSTGSDARRIRKRGLNHKASFLFPLAHVPLSNPPFFPLSNLFLSSPPALRMGQKHRLVGLGFKAAVIGTC